ncbi:MAG: terminase TerL endonuclease subunit, partial [Pseudomonadota bacterium]
PVLRWMVANLAKREDPNQNIMPDKSASSDKIDGPAALIMALSRAIVQPVQPATPWLLTTIPRGF